MSDDVIVQMVLTTDEGRKMLACLDERLEGDLNTWKAEWMSELATLVRFWNKTSPQIRKFIEAISAKAAAVGVVGGIPATVFREALKTFLKGVLAKAVSSGVATTAGLLLVDSILVLIAVVALATLMDVFTSCARTLIADLDIF